MKRPSATGNRRGIALLITLAVTTVLITTVLEMNRQARSSLSTAAVMRDRTSLLLMAESGVQVAMAVLIHDKQTSRTDTIQEDWANPLFLQQAMEALSFEDGKVELAIEDEMGKIQVNALVDPPGGHSFNTHQQQLWERFLGIMGPLLEMDEDFEATAVINAVKDWIDAGDDDAITGLTGAESDYYRELDPSYACRNAPLPYLPEMLKIKGVTPHLFFGTEQQPGIAAYLTVWGAAQPTDNTLTFNGKININTAALPVIAAMLPTENQDLAQAIFDYRQEISDDQFANDISAPGWIKNVPGAAGLKIDPKIMTTASDVFRIESKATARERTLTVTTVVQRVQDTTSGKTTCRVLTWRID